MAERVKVKIKKGDTFTYKKYNVNEITVIEDSAVENVDEEELKNKKELEELEKLEKQEENERKGGDNYGI